MKGIDTVDARTKDAVEVGAKSGKKFGQ